MGERVALDVVVRAGVRETFAALTDWCGQDRWMIGTTVRITRGDGHSVGSQVTASTGKGPLALVDPMDIVRWEPPHRVEVRHTGPLIHGWGAMEVTPLPHGMCRVRWTEERDLPLGVAGRLGWPVLRPGITAGLRRSLRRFGRLVESGALPQP